MPLPDRLQEIVDQFAAAPRELRVQALLGFANRVPPLPERYANDRGLLEQVHECQTPFFLAAEVDGDGAVHVWFDCPPETPTVRGFAGILREGLEGETADAVLAVPPDFYRGMGLGEVVSALRLRGMGAILARLKRQVEARRDDGAGGPRSEETET
ncbi:MAG: SufE family protein [Gemmatimonadota bacterium]|nr:SufE family protein [Gemmatimonadota bacterium]